MVEKVFQSSVNSIIAEVNSRYKEDADIIPCKPSFDLSSTSLAVTLSHAFVLCTKLSICNKPYINTGIFHSEATV